MGGYDSRVFLVVIEVRWKVDVGGDCPGHAREGNALDGHGHYGPVDSIEDVQYVFNRAGKMPAFKDQRGQLVAVIPL